MMKKWHHCTWDIPISADYLPGGKACGIVQSMLQAGESLGKAVKLSNACHEELTQIKNHTHEAKILTNCEMERYIVHESHLLAEMQFVVINIAQSSLFF